MAIRLKRSLFTLLGITSLALAACGTTPSTSFYSLSAEAEAVEAPAGMMSTVIGIGPVEVAPYLERSQIVIRTADTRLSLTEFDRWAEPIENNIANVLAENLSRLLPATQPIVRPWADAGAEYNVVVKLRRFDSDEAGNVTLNASWGIQRHSTRSMPVISEANIVQQSTGSDYESITQTMSAALAVLSKQIADALQQEMTRKPDEVTES